MAGRKPRGRGVLAGLLRMTNEQAGDNGASASAATSPRLAPGALGEPAPQSAPISPEMRESYEPGWYRISVAPTPGEEWTEDPAAAALAKMQPVSTPPDESPLECEEAEVEPPLPELPSFEMPAADTPSYGTPTLEATSF